MHADLEYLYKNKIYVLDFQILHSKTTQAPFQLCKFSVLKQALFRAQCWHQQGDYEYYDSSVDKSKMFWSKHIPYKKRDFIIEKKFCGISFNTINIFQIPLSFYATQIISPFLTLRISANHDKELGFKPIGESLYVPLVYNLFSFYPE